MTNLIGQGLSAIGTLNLIAQSSSKAKKIIEALLGKGMSPEDIVDKLQISPGKASPMDRFSVPRGTTEQVRSRDLTRNRDAALIDSLKDTGIAAATGLGTYGLYKAGQAAMPHILQRLGVGGGGQPPTPGTPNSPNTPPNTPPNAPNVPQNTPPNPLGTPPPVNILKGVLGKGANAVGGALASPATKDIVKSVMQSFGFKNAPLIKLVTEAVQKTGKSIQELHDEAAAIGDISTPDKAAESVNAVLAKDVNPDESLNILGKKTQQETMQDMNDFRQKALEGIDMESLSPTRQNRISNVLSQLELLRKEGVKETDPRYKALSKQIKGIKSGKALTFADKEEERLHGSSGSRPAILKDGTEGEILNVKKGVAEVETPEGIRRQKVEDIIESPIPKRELADLYLDMIKGIEEETGQEVSKSVYWAGYDPKRNALSYIPHDGSLYTYDDISPERKERLTNLLQQRRTSGESYVGAWTEGTASPIGSQMSDLIRELQKERGGKGNEYSGKYEVLYSSDEPARKAAKERKKRMKDEEKAKKKK